MVVEERIRRRRWLRFSLRTLFVAVTVLALALWYPLHWIHQRHKLLDDNFARMKQVGVPYWDIHGRFELLVRNPPARAPWLLRLFGEKPVDSVTMLYIVEKPPRKVTWDMMRDKRLFPEADITWSFVDRNGKFFPAEEE